jgi:hypothetical protein
VNVVLQVAQCTLQSSEDDFVVFLSDAHFSVCITFIPCKELSAR